MTNSYLVTDGADAAGSADDVTLRLRDRPWPSPMARIATIDFSPTMTNLTNDTITLTTDDTSPANVYGPTAFVINVGRHRDRRLGASRADPERRRGPAALRRDQHGCADAGKPDHHRAAWPRGEMAANRAKAAVEVALPAWGARVFDDGGAFTAEGVTFTNNVADGGHGGNGNVGNSKVGGGGGGLAGSGQSGSAGGRPANGGGAGGTSGH